MSEEKYRILMSRYLAGDLSQAETDELLQWVDDDPSRAILLQEFRETWEKTKEYPGRIEVDKQAAWSKIRQRIEVPEEAVVRSMNFSKMIRIAAGFIILIAAGLIGYNYYADSRMIHVQTLAGEHREVVLPDGSKISMNESSSLSYHQNFNDRTLREVELKGEAFFEVTKNPQRRFVISTGKTLTQVLGTSFNVRQDSAEGVGVAVVTGKVSFGPENEKAKEYILLPGDEALYDQGGTMSRGKYADPNFLFWKDHKLAFNNAEVKTVLETIENAYKVNFDIQSKDILTRKITTSFNEAPFSQVTEVLRVLLDLDITKKGSVYVVSKKQ